MRMISDLIEVLSNTSKPIAGDKREVKRRNLKALWSPSDQTANIIRILFCIDSHAVLAIRIHF